MNQLTTFKPTFGQIVAGLFVLLIVSILLAFSLGSERLSFFDLSEQQHAILFSIRIPRVLLAVSVGACLAVAGASYQALLRNPC